MTGPPSPAGGPPPPIHPTVVAAELVPERAGCLSILSSVKRGGDWPLPRNMRAMALLGSVDLDLTRARVGPGTTYLEVRAVLGSVTILVPHDLRVEVDGEPVIGSFDLILKSRQPAPPDAPLVRISGKAVLGSVEVKVIDPNAPKWYERLRAR